MWFRVSKSRARIAKCLFVPYTFLNDWSWPVVARYDELNFAKITAICDPNLEFGRQRM